MFCKGSGLPKSLKLRHQFSSAKTRCKGWTSAGLHLAPVQASCSWNKENLEGEMTGVGRKVEGEITVVGRK